ncbi:DUF924 family protein [Pseudomonas aeruginosa]|uniref:DUF924 family protein n=1 Tax=Pseudomonas aeruginosa TaxID=287 RepID=UPI00383BD15E
MKLFFCLPFAHSEDASAQDFSVMLSTRLGQPWLTHAEGYREAIRRFHRFPYRNRLLGHDSTPKEERFLKEGGFAVKLNQYRIFIRVSDMGSFIKAALLLKLPRASVSAAIQEVETDLGVRLLHRTTRRGRLTDDGTKLMERAR